MKLYEVVVTEHSSKVFRVKANSPKEAKEIFEEFMDEDPDGSAYIAEELDMNGTKEWTWGPFEERYTSPCDEKPTITKNEDGTFDARYEGGITE